ncbi:hypothetical protein EV360DRAFT_74275 [Lentinula raphanica]|nr:hypothetical protein EV360DRAFT_74275 [Lentinula raphanica]
MSTLDINRFERTFVPPNPVFQNHSPSKPVSLEGLMGKEGKKHAARDYSGLFLGLIIRFVVLRLIGLSLRLIRFRCPTDALLSAYFFAVVFIVIITAATCIFTGSSPRMVSNTSDDQYIFINILHILRCGIGAYLDSASSFKRNAMISSVFDKKEDNNPGPKRGWHNTERFRVVSAPTSVRFDDEWKREVEVSVCFSFPVKSMRYWVVFCTAIVLIVGEPFPPSLLKFPAIFTTLTLPLFDRYASILRPSLSPLRALFVTLTARISSLTSDKLNGEPSFGASSSCRTGYAFFVAGGHCLYIMSRYSHRTAIVDPSHR